MDNPETRATLGTQDTGRRQTKKEEQISQHNTEKTKTDEEHEPHKNRG